MKEELRKLAISLLDDEDGLCLDEYELLATCLKKTGSEDICKAVNTSDGRVFLGEDDAEEFRHPPEVIDHPLCSQCEHVQTQTVMGSMLSNGHGDDEVDEVDEVAGCNKLSNGDWKTGWDFENGLNNNCPLVN